MVLLPQILSTIPSIFYPAATKDIIKQLYSKNAEAAAAMYVVNKDKQLAKMILSNKLDADRLVETDLHIDMM
jgi:hypothetical protein